MDCNKEIKEIKDISILQDTILQLQKDNRYYERTLIKNKLKIEKLVKQIQNLCEHEFTLDDTFDFHSSFSCKFCNLDKRDYDGIYKL